MKRLATEEERFALYQRTTSLIDNIAEFKDVTMQLAIWQRSGVEFKELMQHIKEDGNDQDRNTFNQVLHHGIGVDLNEKLNNLKQILRKIITFEKGDLASQLTHFSRAFLRQLDNEL